MTLAHTAMGALGAASMPLLATFDPTASDPALIIFGKEISEALAFDRMLGHPECTPDGETIPR